jgi:excisionase family DNA binding protein
MPGPDPSPVIDAVPPERLALGEASRLLGVDPDTLRRWADEGRVPAFTTPGGHRRFERRALERLMTTRHTGPAGALAGVGVSPDRLSAAYRRRYGARRPAGPDPRATVPEATHDAFRTLGRQLVQALVRHVDAAGSERAVAEREALALAGELGQHAAEADLPLADGVAMVVAARRPLLAELRAMARRPGIDAAAVADLYDAAIGLLDRILLAFVVAHGGRTP